MAISGVSEEELNNKAKAMIREILSQINVTLPAELSREVIEKELIQEAIGLGPLEYLISRRPERILHLFCGADEIVPALKVYLANGCKIEKILPFDFFPGTMNLEVLAVIRKKPADKPERSRNRHR